MSIDQINNRFWVGTGATVMDGMVVRMTVTVSFVDTPGMVIMLRWTMCITSNTETLPSRLLRMWSLLH